VLWRAPESTNAGWLTNWRNKRSAQAAVTELTVALMRMNDKGAAGEDCAWLLVMLLICADGKSPGRQR
jgi:hypothetical protein